MAGRSKKGKGKGRDTDTAKVEALIEAALQVCDAIEDICDEEGIDCIQSTAVLAARLIHEGDREALLATSRTSIEMVSDADILEIIADLDEDGEDEDEDEEED